jgi:hypothetical protein
MSTFKADMEEVLAEYWPEDLARLTSADTPDFFENQPIYNKLSIQQSTMNTNTMENKMENKMENGRPLTWQDHVRFEVKCDAHATLEEIVAAHELVQEALKLYDDKAKNYPVFAHFYHEKYLEYEEGKLTVAEMVEIMKPDPPTNYEELYNAAVKVEPALSQIVHNAERALRGGKVSWDKVITELCELCPYTRSMIEWRLRDFKPKDETRPMAVCITCCSRFPYGSADGQCDKCQIAERMTTCDDLLCKCCNRRLNEAEQVMVGKLLKIRDLCDEAEKTQKNLIFFSTVGVPEEACEKYYFPRMRRSYVLVAENLKLVITSFRENLGNLKAQPLIKGSEQLVFYWIREHLVNDTPMPIISRVIHEKLRMLDCEDDEIKERDRLEKQQKLEKEAEKEAEKKAKAAAKKAEEEAKKAAAKEKSKSAFNPPEYPPAQKIKCKGSAQMISNAPAQRAWLEKWAKDAWNGKDLWSAKTAKQYVADKKNGVGTIFATAVVVEAVIFDGVEAEPIED